MAPRALLHLAFATLATASSLQAQQFRRDVPIVLAPGEGLSFAADLDGDGDSDLVIVDTLQMHLQILSNLGDGRFVRQPQNALTKAANGMWASGDIDGDGDVDFLSAVSGPQSGFLLVRNDNTALTDVSTTHLVSTTPFEAGLPVLVDVDQDGDLDFVAFLSTRTQLFRNSGTGVFTEITPSALPTVAGVSSVIAHDVDGDGAADLVIASGQGPLLWLQRQGTYVDETATRMPLLTSSARHVTAIDFDRDGDPDLVFASGTMPTARLYENNGSGSFTDVTAQRLAQPPIPLDRVLALDFEGDGAPDLLFSLNGQGSYLLRNDGQGNYAIELANWRGDMPINAAILQSLDLERDRFPDLLSSSYVLRNLAGRTLQSMTSSRPFSPSLIFDADGDGDLDAATTTTLWRNECGRFTPETMSVGIPETGGDLDGDGDVDLVCRAGSFLEIRFNDGHGSFANGYRLASTAAVLSGVALGDVDGDGDLDLATAEGLDLGSLWAQSRLFLNNGSGQFADVTSSNVPPRLGGMRSVRFGDADGDGDLDLLYATFTVSPGPPAVRYYANQGNGVFVDASNLIPTAATTASLPWAQFAQLDGDPELEIVFLRGRELEIYDRLGGVWQDVTASRLPAGLVAASLTVPLLDFDEDGDVDMLVDTGTALRVLANDGSGHFVDVTASRGAGLFGIGVPADIDGDGDVDLVGAYILLNQQRQLRLPLPPRTGTSLVLEFVVEPGFGTGTHLAMIGMSLGRAPHPAVTPFGTFQLGAGSMLVAAMLSTAGGPGTATLAVPAAPSLSGLRLYLQGIEVALPSGNFHFTNAVVTAIE